MYMHEKMNIGFNNSRLLIDLAALRRNVVSILNSLTEGQMLIPVLKDDAYGLGIEKIASVLSAFPQIKTFAVAHVSEGIALRRVGIDLNILVMGGVPAHLIAPAVAEDLTLAVGRPSLAAEIAHCAAAQGKTADIQIKIETGLNRTGVKQGQEAEALLAILAEQKSLYVSGAFSHFADLSDTERTQQQFDRFANAVQQLEQSGLSLPLKHIAASEASELYPRFGLNAVRIGRRLYMDHPTKPLGGIEEVASWQSWVTHVRTLQAGEYLGYGGSFRLQKETTVATIGVGYGDGLNLDLVERGGPVLIAGKAAKLLACCMDQCFIDVTDIACRIGDMVTFFGYDGAGGYLSSQKVALLVGENEGCGLTSALSKRVDRIYQE